MQNITLTDQTKKFIEEFFQSPPIPKGLDKISTELVELVCKQALLWSYHHLHNTKDFDEVQECIQKLETEVFGFSSSL